MLAHASKTANSDQAIADSSKKRIPCVCDAMARKCSEIGSLIEMTVVRRCLCLSHRTVIAHDGLSHCNEYRKS
jgi:hypothetical protein